MGTYDSLITVRVRAGKAFLDEKVPGWQGKVQRTLSMVNIRSCLLGQLYGEYWRGLSKLGISHNHALDLGFRAAAKELDNNLEKLDDYYAELNAAWEQELS